MQHASHPAMARQLKQAHGQLASIMTMLADGCPCGDLAQQLQAVESIVRTAKRTLIQDPIWSGTAAWVVVNRPCANLKRCPSTLEAEWTPRMRELLDIDRNLLPVIWDADFLYGPRTAGGEDTYVLCEINVSSVIPFPPEGPAEMAALVRQRLLAAKAERPG